MQQAASFLSSPPGRRFALGLLTASYVAGVIGLLLPVSRPLFQALTPFHLLLTAGILFLFHPHWDKKFVLFCILAFAVGYGVEVLGVATGAIFGEYRYGTAFGLKVLEVPLLIGLNWLVLVYCTGVICERLPWPLLAKAALAAALMVGLDVLIEPLSATYNFWFWQDNVIPLQNFIAWYITAFLLQLLFNRLSEVKKNPIALPLYILQLLFFASLLLFT